jgi:hypothetical protein
MHKSASWVITDAITVLRFVDKYHGFAVILFSRLYIDDQSDRREYAPFTNGAWHMPFACRVNVRMYCSRVWNRPIVMFTGCSFACFFSCFLRTSAQLNP